MTHPRLRSDLLKPWTACVGAALLLLIVALLAVTSTPGLAQSGGASASTPTLSDGVVSSVGKTGSDQPEEQAYLIVTLYENGTQVAQVKRTCAPNCPGFSDTVSYTCKSSKASKFYATAQSTYGNGRSSTVTLACH
jgi:hypothetical protein